MYQEQNNLNQNYNNVFNQQQYPQQNKQISNNRNHIFSPKTGLTISTINFIFCVLSFALIIDLYMIQAKNSGYGFIYIFAPLQLLIYSLDFIPDGLCLLFSISYNSKKKIIYPILIIVASIIGCMTVNQPYITSIFDGNAIVQIIYTLLKIILILFNIIVLYLYKKDKK